MPLGILEARRDDRAVTPLRLHEARRFKLFVGTRDRAWRETEFGGERAGGSFTPGVSAPSAIRETSTSRNCSKGGTAEAWSISMFVMLRLYGCYDPSAASVYGMRRACGRS